MLPCNHEETDSRMSLHIKDTLEKGARKILVRTVDTDVVVILAGIFFSFVSAYPDVHLWVGFGSGKYFRYYIMIYMNFWVMKKSQALFFFHVVPHSFMVKAKRQHGNHGTLILRSRKHFFLQPCNHFIFWLTNTSDNMKTLERYKDLDACNTISPLL